MPNFFRWCHYCGKRHNLTQVEIWKRENMKTEKMKIDICPDCATRSIHCHYCTLTHTPGHCLD